jgi:hypothetical protein
MQKENNTTDLSVINQKIVAEGEQLPLVKLKDGTSVQTGTVATMLHNVKMYNAGERGTIEAQLTAAIPTLVKVGLFDLFSIEEWVTGDNPGRKFVGLKAKDFLQLLKI